MLEVPPPEDLQEIEERFPKVSTTIRLSRQALAIACATYPNGTGPGRMGLEVKCPFA